MGSAKSASRTKGASVRPAIINFCSTAIDMLRFSTKMIFENAGTEDFDYFVVTWLPTPDVNSWLTTAPYPINQVLHGTQPGLAYVPQLRAMMNRGFDIGYAASDWVALVNTDMAFGRNWLSNLMRRAISPEVIPNSLHITPVDGTNTIKRDLGVPTAERFNLQGFWKLHDALYQDKVQTQDEMPHGWEDCATFPYLLHHRWWKEYGPWAHEFDGIEAPDRRFFRRCAHAGAKFVLVHDSIVYHHEAVERRGARPPGAEGMPEGA